MRAARDEKRCEIARVGAQDLVAVSRQHDDRRIDDAVVPRALDCDQRAGSTFVYPELTTRLTMSIGGARPLEEVNDGSWVKLAGDAAYRPAFVTKTVSDLLKRAAVEAPALIAMSAHDNDTARQIDERIQRPANR